MWFDLIDETIVLINWYCMIEIDAYVFILIFTIEYILWDDEYLIVWMIIF